MSEQRLECTLVFHRGRLAFASTLSERTAYGVCLLVRGEVMRRESAVHRISLMRPSRSSARDSRAWGLQSRVSRRVGFEFTIFERRETKWAGPGCKTLIQAASVMCRRISIRFLYAQNPDWSHSYSFQPEIFIYLKQVARQFDLLRHVQFEQAITDAVWDDVHKQWNLETSRTLIRQRTDPRRWFPALPCLAGLGDVSGKAFHSAAWDHDYDLRKKGRGNRYRVFGDSVCAQNPAAGRTAVCLSADALGYAAR